jgi:hypothetical protein
VEEPDDPSVHGVPLHFPGIALGKDPPGAPVEQDDPVGKVEKRGQVMGHHDHGRSHGGTDPADENLQFGGRDRVQAGKRLVEEENPGIQGHGPCQAGLFCIPPDSSAG